MAVRMQWRVRPEKRIVDRGDEPWQSKMALLGNENGKIATLLTRVLGKLLPWWHFRRSATLGFYFLARRR